MKKNIIEYIVKTTDLRQTDIADRLGVSRAQVSKWKAGEFIPFDRQKELNEMAGLFGDDSEWAMITRTKENAEGWIRYFKILPEFLECTANVQLIDEPELYARHVLTTLSNVGLQIPANPPALLTCWESDTDEDCVEDKMHDLIKEYVEINNALLNWCHHYIDGNNEDLFEFIVNLEGLSFDISVKYVRKELIELGVDETRLISFIYMAEKSAGEEIHQLCTTMNRLGLPLMTDYFDLIKTNPYQLDDELMLVDCVNSIDNYLPYVDRMLLRSMDVIKQQLDKLISNSQNH